MQPGDVSHALIQQGERERLRKTPSSSSTTAWWWWRSVAILQGFAKHRGRGGRCVMGGRGRRQGLDWFAPPFSPLYIGPRERGRRSPCPFLQGRVRPRVGRSPSSPRHLGGAFPL